MDGITVRRHYNGDASSDAEELIQDRETLTENDLPTKALPIAPEHFMTSKRCPRVLKVLFSCLKKQLGEAGFQILQALLCNDFWSFRKIKNLD